MSVGATGFEPATSRPPAVHSNQTEPHPVNSYIINDLYSNVKRTLSHISSKIPYNNSVDTRKGVFSLPIYQNQINQHRSCQSGHSCNCRRPVPEPCNHPVSQKIQPIPAKPDCGCGIKDPLEDFPIAMAYVPWQRWRDLYDSNKGFHRGTIFRELDKSFCGKGGVCQ